MAEHLRRAGAEQSVGGTARAASANPEALETLKLFYDQICNIEVSASEVMPSAFNLYQNCRSRYRPERFLKLIGGSKRISRSVDEQRRNPQPRKMTGSQTAGFARRMQRIGEKQKSLDQFRFIGGEHARLAASIRLTAEENTPRHDAPHSLDRTLETGAILRRGARRRRSIRPLLPKRKIASQDGDSSRREGIGDGGQQRHFAISARAVSEYQSVGSLGAVQKSAN